MPNDGAGIVQSKITNQYTGVTTNKIGTTSGNDTTISKAMRYSQFVNNNRGFKNAETFTHQQYMKRYGHLGPLTQINNSCYTLPMFQPQVLRSSNTRVITKAQNFIFAKNF